jgi:hypothetical protein
MRSTGNNIPDLNLEGTMSIQIAEARPPKASHRRLVDLAREFDRSPQAWIRDILKGRPLASGSRLYLKGTRFPDGWRVSDADLTAFLEALTADKLGAHGVIPAPTSARSSASHEAADRQLEAAGW